MSVQNTSSSCHLSAGDKVYAQTHGKAVIFAHIGAKPLVNGLNILGAHIDSPRLDLKQNPLFERNGLVHLDTHYYGGIKHYQWVTLPLALHGVVAKKDGSVVQVNVGEDADDPVFCVSDLLIHLAKDQMKKTASEVVAAEDLDVLVGSRPMVLSDADKKKEDADKSDLEKLAAKEPVKAFVLQLLAKKYGMEEEDFLSAEIEVVPAGPARELGFDRSMVIGYGHDDRVCAYTSLRAILETPAPKKTAVCLLTDKEEIGSVGATGAQSFFFENTVAEILNLMGETNNLAVRHALSRSRMISSDVSAGFDPIYPGVNESKNSAFLGHGICFNKFTGARGKSGSNDANAEYVAVIRKIMDDNKVAFQTCELGKVDQGGGGTIAYISAKYGMEVIDAGVPVLSMHAPWEVVSKADVYEAVKCYKAFLKDA